MDESKRWQLIFATSVAVGFFMIVLLILIIPDQALGNGLRILSIFLGMLAGFSLGEYFKIKNNKKIGEELLTDITEEIRINEALLDNEMQLRKGFWILGIRSGLVRYIPREERRMLWEIYSNITHYNDEIQTIHYARLGQTSFKPTPELVQEISRLRGLIGALIRDFLQYKGLSQA